MQQKQIVRYVVLLWLSWVVGDVIWRQIPRVNYGPSGSPTVAEYDGKLSNTTVYETLDTESSMFLDGQVLQTESFQWPSGEIQGNGTIHIRNNGFAGSGTGKCFLDCTLENHGSLVIHASNFAMGSNARIVNYGSLYLVSNSMHDILLRASDKARVENFGTLYIEMHAKSFSMTNQFLSQSRMYCDVPIDNSGKIELASATKATFTSVTSQSGALIRVNSDAELTISGFVTGNIQLWNSTLIGTDNIHTRSLCVVAESTANSRVVFATDSLILQETSFDGPTDVLLLSGVIKAQGRVRFGTESSLTILGGSFHALYPEDFFLSPNSIFRSVFSVEGTLLLGSDNLDLRPGVSIVSNGYTLLGSNNFVQDEMPQQGAQEPYLTLFPNSTLCLQAIETKGKTARMEPFRAPLSCRDLYIIPLKLKRASRNDLSGCIFYTNKFNNFSSTMERDNIKFAGMCDMYLRGDMVSECQDLSTYLSMATKGYNDKGAAPSTVSHSEMRESIDQAHNNFAEETIDALRAIYQSIGGYYTLYHSGAILLDNSWPIFSHEASPSYVPRISLPYPIEQTPHPDEKVGSMHIPQKSDYDALSDEMRRYLYLEGRVPEKTASNLLTNRKQAVPLLRGRIANTSVTQYSYAGEDIYAFFLFAPLSAVLLLFATLLYASGSIESLVKELRVAPPLDLHLSYYEFNYLAQNYWNISAILLEILILCTKPHYLLSGISLFREVYVVSYLEKFVGLAIVAWIVLWLAMFWDNSIFGDKQFIFDSFLSAGHSVLSWITNSLYYPLVCLLMSRAVEKPESLHRFATFLAFTWIVPNISHNTQFPMAHPPYQRDSDLRHKRGFVTLRSCVLILRSTTLHFLVWRGMNTRFYKLYWDIVLFLLHYWARPCAFKNVNKIQGGLYLCVTFVSFFDCVQDSVQDRSLFIFTIAQNLAVKLLLSAIFSFLASHFCTLVSEDDDTELEIDPTDLETNTRWKQALFNTEEALLEHKTRIHKAPLSEKRELLDQWRDLKTEHTTILNAYHAFLERYLVLFYLSKGPRRRRTLPKRLSLPSPPPTPLPLPLLDPSPPPLTGRLAIASHELEKAFRRGPVIGKGNYGTVYVGLLRYRGTPRLVAVKEIALSSGELRATEHEALKAELAMLQTLSHPHVIRYYGSVVTAHTMALFMEYASGGNLTALCRRFHGLGHALIAHYTREMLQGLAYLHGHNIVHRDIKGENILIDSEGHVRLADFGCSRILSATVNPTGCVGSPYFMAPEVIKHGPYGTKADIWSVGCTVVEMLNGGDVPWSENFENIYSALLFISTHEGLPTNVPETIDPECRDFLEHCFRHDPEERWSATGLMGHPWLRNRTRGQAEDGPSSPLPAQVESSVVSWETGSHAGESLQSEWVASPANAVMRHP